MSNNSSLEKLNTSRINIRAGQEFERLVSKTTELLENAKENITEHEIYELCYVDEFGKELIERIGSSTDGVTDVSRVSLVGYEQAVRDIGKSVDIVYGLYELNKNTESVASVDKHKAVRESKIIPGRTNGLTTQKKKTVVKPSQIIIQYFKNQVVRIVIMAVLLVTLMIPSNPLMSIVNTVTETVVGAVGSVAVADGAAAAEVPVSMSVGFSKLLTTAISIMTYLLVMFTILRTTVDIMYICLPFFRNIILKEKAKSLVGEEITGLCEKTDEVEEVTYEELESKERYYMIRLGRSLTESKGKGKNDKYSLEELKSAAKIEVQEDFKYIQIGDEGAA